MAERVPEAPADGVGRLDDADVHARLERLDDLLDRVEQVPGPTTDAAMEAVQLLTEVYGEAMTRMLALAGDGSVGRCVQDELLRHLMVLHDLHPDSIETRVRQVLDELGPQLESRGAQVELTAIDDGVARVRVVGGGGCSGCSSTGDLDDALAEAVLTLAPELAEVDTAHEPGADAAQAVIPVEALLRRPAAAGGPP